MKKTRPFAFLILILAIASNFLNAQEPYIQDEAYCSEAYEACKHTAHWSVYIPLVLTAGAAVWFALCESKHKEIHSNSQDALGSIANSKRVPCGISGENHISSHHKYVSRSKTPWGFSH